ncbi:MAG: 50S ribosomal protein L13 [Candidatus Aenigmarchaeota archaeon ex4484_52]|nr:MAG: 50S ribosomal protein L13 [Candidatus Aenigmarchaeota archaeon ex4484_52]
MAITINGNGLVLGRLASFVAKKIIKDNEDVIIYNAKKIIISGSKKDIVSKYKHRRERGDSIRGPFFPKTPQGIVRHAIRGMLGYTKKNGKERFRHLKVFIAEEYEGEKETPNINIKAVNNLDSKYITIEQLAKELGYNS